MKLSRRTVLRGLLGGTAITVGLPPLEAMLNSSGTAYADGGALPLRFGTWFWGNGMLPSLWTPTGEGEGDAWALSEQLSPLAPVKHLITVVTGMEVRVLNAIPHTSGAAGFLTGIEPIGEEGDHTFGGPTVDQVVAAEIGGDSRFRSLQTGARPGGRHLLQRPPLVQPRRVLAYRALRAALRRGLPGSWREHRAGPSTGPASVGLGRRARPRKHPPEAASALRTKPASTST